MKKSVMSLSIGIALVCTLSSVMCASAHADTRENSRGWWYVLDLDAHPFMASLKKTFDQAKLPNEDDLQLGRDWTCNLYYAAVRSTGEDTSDSILNMKGQFNFSTIVSGVYDNTGKNEHKSFSERKGGLASVLQETNSRRMSLRKTAKGDLIAREDIVSHFAQDGQPFMVKFYVCPNTPVAPIDLDESLPVRRH